MTSRITIILISMFVSACTMTSPSKRYHLKATKLGLEIENIDTGQFTLSVFRNQRPPGKFFHVYLEGDGVPFHRAVHIKPDPTSIEAVALEMIANDPHQGVLIGRPCYHQLVSSALCESSKWWTSHRYSQAVIDSLQTAINRYAGNRPIRIIGFSGGGSLALLLASQSSEKVGLATVSANLDTQAWAMSNNFTPLYGSLNPIDSATAALENTHNQVHFVGQDDENLNYHLWLDALEKQSNTRVVIKRNYSHTCCWASNWGDLLKRHLPN